MKASNLDGGQDPAHDQGGRNEILPGAGVEISAARSAQNQRWSNDSRKHSKGMLKPWISLCYRYEYTRE
jgi:hypothetical protein